MAENKKGKTSTNPQSSGNKGSKPVTPAKEADPKETSAGSPRVQKASAKGSSGKEASAKLAAEEDTSAKKPAAGDEAAESGSYLKDLMSISGQGGLFRFVSQGRNGIIVESLETGKRMQAFASMKVSALEDIAVYTSEEEMQLEEVLAAIHKYESGKEAISPKSDADELKDYFSAVLPDYDRERVYVSDIKKILGWYNLLLKHNLIEVGKSLKKSPEKKSESKADHPLAAAKTPARPQMKKETGSVHAKIDSRGSGKIPGGKKSPSRGD